MFAILGLTMLSTSPGDLIVANSSLTMLLTASGCLTAALALVELLVPAINPVRDVSLAGEGGIKEVAGRHPSKVPPCILLSSAQIVHRRREWQGK